MMEHAKNMKNNIKEQKRIYLTIFLVMMIGLLVGAVFALLLSKSDHTLVKESLDHFFSDIHKNKIDYTQALVNSLIGNLSFLLLLWLFGISIIGIPIIYLFCFFKTFVFGFSISSILYTYKIKGILRSIAYIFPHQIVFLLLTVFLAFYAIYFSKKLFSYLFLKKEINLRHSMKRYLQVLLISLGGSILCSLFEIFISPTIIQLFY